MLLERASDTNAYKKTCSHFIQASAVGTIERLGIRERLIDAGVVRSSFNTWTPFGWIEQGSEVDGWNIRRERLDPMLRRMAAETKGVELRMGRTVKALVEDGERVVGVVTHRSKGKGDVANDDAEEHRANVVVGADGRHSKVAALAAFDTTTCDNGRFIYQAYYAGMPLPGGRPHLWVLNPDNLYAVPTDGGLTCLVTMPHKSRIPEFKADLDEAFARNFERAEQAPRVRDAERVSEFFGMLEIPNHVRPAAKNGVCLVGDAAMTSDPLFGVGVGWALETGEWVAEDITDAAVDGDPAAIHRALETYATHHRERLRHHHELINKVSVGKPLNVFESLLLGAAARDPGGFGADFARLSARLVQPGEVLTLRNIARAAWIRATKKPSRPIAHAQGVAHFDFK